MTEPHIRIFSDVHYGDRVSMVRSLSQLDPLLEGPSTVVLNGDTFDTRISPHPERTAAHRAEVLAYFAAAKPKIVMMTGNHDPDITESHADVFAGGQVFVTHGDILFDDIVPWSTEAALLRGRILEGQVGWTAAEKESLERQLELFRDVCATLPQRHQAEPNPVKYALSYLNDTVWPPTRILSMFQSWHRAPELAASLARQHRPDAKFIILGHLHRPGVWPTRDGRVVINTGSFCPPFGACLVDLTPGHLKVRRVASRDGGFYPGKMLAEFALADAVVSPNTAP